MTCLETYQLPCGDNCGLWIMPFVATYTGWHWIQWVYAGVTYKKKVWAIVNKPIGIYYPFQSHGIYVFQILDEYFQVISYDVDGMTYDCFKVIGLPTYEIPAPELEALLAYCQTLNLAVELNGTGTLSISLTLTDNSSPLDLAAALNGTGTLNIGFTVFKVLAAELNGTGTLNVDTDSFIISPGVSVPFLSNDENAYVAYSNRLVHYDYVGDCMEVERLLDGATADIPFGSKGWRDDTALAAFLSGTAGRIKTWYNQTGLGPDLVQATPANRMRVATPGGSPYAHNGKQVIYHNGGSGLGLETGSWGPANAVGTIAQVVFQFNKASFMHLHGGDASGDFIGYGDSSANNHHAGAGSVPSYTVDAGTAETNQTRSKYRNNVMLDMHHVWFKGPNTSAWPLLGVGRYTGADFYGYMGELVIWESDKSAQQAAYTANMMGNWGL